MKYLSKILLLSAAILGFSSAAVQAASFKADLGALSGSGVTGPALFDLSDGQKMLTVTTNATGLEPNQDHVQHIHGLFDVSGAIAVLPVAAGEIEAVGRRLCLSRMRSQP